MTRSLAGLVGTCILCGLVMLPAHAQQPMPKRLVGDYGYWSRTQAPPYSSAQIPFGKLTHINHAGVAFNADGSLAVPTDPPFLELELIRKAHAAGVKVLLLLGGDFAGIETTPGGLETLLANLRTFITTNDYDGLDIDWEYPSSTTDTHLFYALMTGLRHTFPRPRYLLSADVPPWGEPERCPGPGTGDRLLERYDVRLRRALDRRRSAQLADFFGIPTIRNPGNASRGAASSKLPIST